MAAGTSSRYGAPKQLETFGKRNLTIAEHNVLDAISVGFTNFVFVVREQMADTFHRRLTNLLPDNCTFSLVYQRGEKELYKYCNRTKPWGTGHALLSAKVAVQGNQGNFGLTNADDLYGKDAIDKLANFLKMADANSPIFANVGYRIGDTLSGNGTVSRSVMSISGDGNLVNITEHKNISRNGEIRSEDGTKFDHDALVSMNLWGFTTKIFTILDEQWTEFTQNISDPSVDEFYLPFAVDKAMRDKKCEVKVLKTISNWRGITYAQDRIGLEDFLQEN
jgi:NDP-sugar pyrophosphorylase family protein